MIKTPRSRFEKLFTGMKMLIKHQPAANMRAANGKFFIGDTGDEYLSRGAKDYLEKLGFKEEDGMFSFSVGDETP